MPLFSVCSVSGKDYTPEARKLNEDGVDYKVIDIHYVGDIIELIKRGGEMVAVTRPVFEDTIGSLIIYDLPLRREEKDTIMAAIGGGVGGQYDV